MYKNYPTESIPNNTYGFTLKETKTSEQNLSELDYLDALKDIEKRGTIVNLVYETKTKTGKKARLHCHGVCIFKKIPKLISICPNHFSCKFERIYDEHGWNKYMQKNNENINNMYMF